MGLIFSLFTALANIKAIAGYIETFASAVTGWYVQKQTTETLSQISDAAAFAARAKTDDDRYQAAEKWRVALSRPRASA